MIIHLLDLALNLIDKLLVFQWGLTALHFVAGFVLLKRHQVVSVMKIKLI